MNRLIERRVLLKQSLFAAGAMSICLLAKSSAAPLAAAPAKQVIVIFLQGGLSHLDSWDLKPNAPSEYRGEFQSIATRVPGFAVCEHLPKLAALARQYSVMRSVYHGTPSHEAAIHWTLTGYDYPGANTTKRQATAALRWAERTRAECRSLLGLK